jgi:hypothetical protein
MVLSYWSKFATLRLFVETMPIYIAVGTGRGTQGVLQRKNTFKFKITLHRHNAIQNLNYYVLPDPPHFSLPSTFKFQRCQIVENAESAKSAENAKTPRDAIFFPQNFIFLSFSFLFCQKIT